jgi:hypothetical protein
VRNVGDCEFRKIQFQAVCGVGRNVVSADGNISVGVLSREHSAGICATLKMRTVPTAKHKVTLPTHTLTPWLKKL